MSSPGQRVLADPSNSLEAELTKASRRGHIPRRDSFAFPSCDRAKRPPSVLSIANTLPVSAARINVFQGRFGAAELF
jgi:hypothetical protein